MSRDAWFKCDPVVFLHGLEQLKSAEEVAVYTVVIMRIYAVGGPVPNNPAAIGAVAQLTRLKTERIIAALVARGRLKLVGENLMDDRAADELGRRSTLSATRSEAGKMGGRPAKNSGNSDAVSPRNEHETPQKVSKVGGNHEQTAMEFAAPTAENGHSEEPNAFHARAREEEKRRETPYPLRSDSPGFVPLPDQLDQPLTPEQRAELAASASRLSAGRGGDDEGVVRSLTQRIMAEARMVQPPHDMALVGGWVRLGMDPDEIFRIVVRLAASARGAIRGMRYFDAEIRRVSDAKTAPNTANILEFQRIAQRARG